MIQVLSNYLFHLAQFRELVLLEQIDTSALEHPMNRDTPIILSVGGHWVVLLMHFFKFILSMSTLSLS